MFLGNTIPKAANPLAPIDSLAHALGHATLDVAAGLLAGAALSRLLRARGLHWSWAGAAMAVSLLLRPALAGVAPALLVGALYATVRGRRLHRDELDAGADLADAAARRSTPLDLVRLAAGHVALRRLRARAPQGWHRGEELILGQTRRGELVSVPLGGSRGGTHTLLVGATGSGKTVTQTWLALRALERGMGVIVVDPKGDRDMRAALARAARSSGRSFIEWSPHGPCAYNPFASGSDSEIADKLLAAERFTEPHYLRQAQRQLGHVVRSLRAGDLTVDLATVVRHLDPAQLELLARRLPEPERAAALAYLDSLTPRQQSELGGVRDRLAILVESDVGRWLGAGAGESLCFDLLQAVRARAVVYFNLDADSRPLLTQMLGGAIVQDLQTTVAALQRGPVPTLVVIDEFSALAAEHVVRLFARARSGGFSLVLSAQELSDLRLDGNEALLDRVLGNLTAVLAHRQVVPSSAKLIAELAGTTGAWKTARQGDGRVSRTRVHGHVLSADAVMTLGTGWIAAIVLGDGRETRLARVLDPSADGYVRRGQARAA
jgi:TraM recognition site of TraD and TraG/Helicase HerA, central domain